MNLFFVLLSLKRNEQIVVTRTVFTYIRSSINNEKVTKIILTLDHSASSIMSLFGGIRNNIQVLVV